MKIRQVVPVVILCVLLAPMASWAASSRATRALGAIVTGRDGQDLGQLSDLVFDLRDGRISFAVMTTLEDERRIAVPTSLLTPPTGTGAWNLTCDSQRLTGAPDFAKSDLQDHAWAGATIAYFGASQPPQQLAAGSVIVEPAGAEIPALAGPKGATSFVRCSDMVGTAVRDSKGQPVGEIKDVMIDWSDKQMTFAVLDPSGAVGLGHRFLAVAPAALNYSAGGGNLVVNTTRDRLASAPGFDRTAWPSASDKDFVRQTDRFYNRDSD